MTIRQSQILLHGTVGRSVLRANTQDDARTAVGAPEFFFGISIPSPSLGKDRDAYLNLSNGDAYKKVADVWVYQGSLVGGGTGPIGFTYLRPDGVSKYLRPDGVSRYLRP